MLPLRTYFVFSTTTGDLDGEDFHGAAIFIRNLMSAYRDFRNMNYAGRRSRLLRTVQILMYEAIDYRVQYRNLSRSYLV